MSVRLVSGVDLSEQAADFCIDLVKAEPDGVVAGDNDDMDRRGKAAAVQAYGLAEDPFNPVALYRRTMTSPDQHGIAKLVSVLIVSGKKRPGQLFAFIQKTADFSA